MLPFLSDRFFDYSSRESHSSLARAANQLFPSISRFTYRNAFPSFSELIFLTISFRYDFIRIVVHLPSSGKIRRMFFPRSETRISDRNRISSNNRAIAFTSDRKFERGPLRFLKVIDGGDMDVDFVLRSTSGHVMVSEQRESDGMHEVTAQEDGLVKFCFGNTFSHVTDKTIFIDIGVDRNYDDDWSEQFQDENVEKEFHTVQVEI